MDLCMIIRRRKLRCIRITLVSFVIAISLLYFVAPIIFKSSPSVQRYFIFRNDGSAEAVNFSFPETENLFGALNQYTITDEGLTLGFWQILPADLIEYIPKRESERQQWFRLQLKDGRPVVLYCHGNHLTRGANYRISMYRVMQRMNFHVIAFDYRGFGDSSPVDPSEDGLVEDALHMFRWIKAKSESPLYIWGHSLGTGVATKTATKLCLVELCPDALFLQAPFTSLEDQVYAARLPSLFKILPWFHYMFVTPLKNQDLLFDNKKNIQDVRCPILILHAEDDNVIPITLGEELYEAALKSRKATQLVRFVAFQKDFGYGHNYLCKAPDLPDVIRLFLKEASPNSKS